MTGMILTGTARLGRDAKLRDAGNSKVADLALAFDYGRKEGDKGRPTQWINAQFWGKRAESLLEYLTSGREVWVVIKDPHIRTYETDNGTKTSLEGEVVEIELGRAPQPKEAAAPPPAAAARPTSAPRPPTAPPSGGAPF